MAIFYLLLFSKMNEENKRELSEINEENKRECFAP